MDLSKSKGFLDLMTIIGPEMSNEIIDQAYKGDPDWVYDLVLEVDDGTPGGTWQEKFHDKLLRLGMGTQSFDWPKVFKELDDEVNKKYPDPFIYEDEDKDNDIDPAGGHGLHSHE